jgi:hypothetical protein
MIKNIDVLQKKFIMSFWIYATKKNQIYICNIYLGKGWEQRKTTMLQINDLNKCSIIKANSYVIHIRYIWS